MAGKSGLIILLGVLTIAALAGAIAVTVLVQTNCNFMLGHSYNCASAKGWKACCPCCDITDVSCYAGCIPQDVQGFGYFMIVLFWVIMGGLLIGTVVLYVKWKREGGERLLG